MDEIDWDILEALQVDGRINFSKLGRLVSMSAPAVTERVRRMEEAGIISGYRAVVNKEKLGIQVGAIVRISFSGPQHYPAIFDALAARPEVRRCHHVTGEDCLVVHVGCQSMVHLEEVVGFMTRYGSTTTSVEFSCPIEFQPITRELLAEPKTTPWGVETA